MRIPDFAIRNQRAVRLAACDAVPPVMVITGPNGCGKSTLLNALRNIAKGAGRSLYLAPHRTSRRQQVQMRFLGQTRIEMSDILSGTSLPGFDGISLPSHERDAWNFDESQSYLKYSLCQIELDRQAALIGRFDSTGEKQKEKEQQQPEEMDLTGLADWRVEVFGRLTKDFPAAFPGGPSHKAGSFICRFV